MLLISQIRLLKFRVLMPITTTIDDYFSTLTSRWNCILCLNFHWHIFIACKFVYSTNTSYTYAEKWHKVIQFDPLTPKSSFLYFNFSLWKILRCGWSNLKWFWKSNFLKVCLAPTTILKWRLFKNPNLNSHWIFMGVHT